MNIISVLIVDPFLKFDFLYFVVSTLISYNLHCLAHHVNYYIYCIKWFLLFPYYPFNVLRFELMAFLTKHSVLAITPPALH